MDYKESLSNRRTRAVVPGMCGLPAMRCCIPIMHIMSVHISSDIATLLPKFLGVCL